MAVRHEEKYIITYSQYAMLKQRARMLLTPDTNGDCGSYVITSLYYDDHKDTALREKLDGLPVHSKFRVRTYDYHDNVIKLERKDKRGILTEKHTASLTREQLLRLEAENGFLWQEEEAAFSLASQMWKAHLKPVVVVRYRRDAFFFKGTDLRLTFDTQLEAISPEKRALFDPGIRGLPVLDGNSVIMEIKYGTHVPAFVRQFTAVPCKQLSVSKYALCRQKNHD